MVRLEDIRIGYGTKSILENGNAQYAAGCSHALIGRNGSGKTTLLRAIAGIMKLAGGKIFVDETELKSLSKQRLGRLVSFVTTEKIRIPRFTCSEIVSLGRAPYSDWIGRLSSKDKEIVEKAMAMVDMTDFADRTMETMSDGECQRIMIARAIAQDTPAIILDEPTSFLDLPNRYELCSILARLAHEEGKSIIFSSHELDIVMRMADTVTLIDKKKLTHLPVKEMRESGLIEETFGITF